MLSAANTVSTQKRQKKTQKSQAQEYFNFLLFELARKGLGRLVLAITAFVYQHYERIKSPYIKHVA